MAYGCPNYLELIATKALYRRTGSLARRHIHGISMGFALQKITRESAFIALNLSVIYLNFAYRL